MSDQIETPALPIWEVKNTPGATHSGEPLEQLTGQVSGTLDSVVDRNDQMRQTVSPTRMGRLSSVTPPLKPTATKTKLIIR